MEIISTASGRDDVFLLVEKLPIPTGLQWLCSFTRSKAKRNYNEKSLLAVLLSAPTALPTSSKAHHC
ncbi:hypothetical protein ILYODFUR_018944 [Ilyodon furcidens]|uniref:Uncharacterized protein n=1 Tax=Ilyodon furcidens TaxID=33524 RepID=A0ABV0TLP3_9TELE